MDIFTDSFLRWYPGHTPLRLDYNFSHGTLNVTGRNFSANTTVNSDGDCRAVMTRHVHWFYGSAIVWTVFVAANMLWQRLSFRPTDYFENPVIVLAEAQYLASEPVLLAGIAAVAVFLLLVGRSAFKPWNTDLRPLRWFIVAITVIHTWPLAFYSYNYLAGQSHDWFRIMLLALCVLTIWSPIALVPLLYFSWVGYWQFAADIGSYSWAMQSMVMKLLLMFSICHIANALSRQSFRYVFLYFAGIVVLTHYWAAGFGKLKIDWAAHGEIHNMLAAAYSNGWLSFLDRSTIGMWAGRMAGFDGFIVGYTLLIEILAVLGMIRIRIAMVVLLLAMPFHIGIFITSGILFWQWILILFLLFVLLAKQRGFAQSAFFGLKGAVLSVLLIGTGPYWVNAVQLAWHDSPLTYSYRFYIRNTAGERVDLPSMWFRPLNYAFVQGAFRYTVDDTTLPVTWGATRSLSAVQQLSAANSVDEVRAVETEFGNNAYDKERTQRLVRFVENRVRHGFSQQRPWYRWIPAPSLLWTYPFEPGKSLKNAQSLHIEQLSHWLDGNQLRKIGTRQVYSGAFKL